MNPSEMTDRDLDRAVEIEVMGTREPRRSGIVLNPGHYTTDGNAMLAVLEAMRDIGYVCNLNASARSDAWSATFHRVVHGALGYQAFAVSAPRAVAEAALEAVREEASG